MTDNIDSRITPSLHPDNVKQIEGYDSETAEVLAPTMTAFSEAYEGVRAIWTARAVVERNQAWNEEARIIQMDGFAQKQLNRITRTFDSVHASLVKGIAALEQQLSQPLESRAAVAVAAEIRGHCKSLPSEQRHSFMQQALNGNDHITASAVLGAPPYLSGFDAQFQQVYTRRWHELQYPAVSKRLTAMKGAKAMIEGRAGLVFGAMENAMGSTFEKARKLREAHTAAERALVVGNP